MQEDLQVQLYGVELWREGLEATAFSCGMASIDAYIKGDQPRRAASSFATSVFVLLEPFSNVIRGYYTLSAMGIVFDELPKKTQRMFARYPQIRATLLGRLGIDRAYKAQLQEQLGQNPGLEDFGYDFVISHVNYSLAGCAALISFTGP